MTPVYRGSTIVTIDIFCFVDVRLRSVSRNYLIFMLVRWSVSDIEIPSLGEGEIPHVRWSGADTEIPSLGEGEIPPLLFMVEFYDY